jgi:hypothetical protein
MSELQLGSGQNSAVVTISAQMMPIDRESMDGLSNALYRDLFAAYEQSFRQHLTENYSQQKQLVFQAVYLAMLQRLAGMLAVDIEMDRNSFVGVAIENYEGASSAAPKWE